MAKVATLNTDLMTLRQQEALQWLIDNRQFLNIKLIEQTSGAYRNSINKHIAGSQKLSQNAAIKLADWVIAFRK